MNKLNTRVWNAVGWMALIGQIIALALIVLIVLFFAAL